MREASVLQVCELHRSHTPANLTVELHHVIPVAWQLTWQPQVAPFPGRDPDGRGALWDARTVACCPTGHRNVHAWIVRMMHAIAGEDPGQAFRAVGGGRGGIQAVTAQLALLRFAQVGGSLQALVAAGEWGNA